MGILILFVAFYLILSHNLSLSGKMSFDFSFLKSTLILSGLIVFSTEFLSLLHCFNFNGVGIFWISIITFEIIIHKQKKINFFYCFNHFKKNISIFFSSQKLTYKVLLISISILLVLILVQGLIYPPNNWDSMTYHLPRVMHWIQNESTNNYATNITRQIYSPPFSEYSIAQIIILTGNDKLSNTVQYFYFLSAIVACVLILKLFTKNIKIISLLVILSATIPEAILQASSTQNDIVHSFFVLSTLYFGLLTIKNSKVDNFFFSGLSAGIGLLSKIIAYFYIPIILIFLSIVLIYKNYNRLLFVIKKLSFIALIIIIVNSAFTLKKIHFNNQISGTTQDIDKGITFEKYSPTILLSTDIKNICLHFDKFFVRDLGNKVAEKSHLLLNLNINEPGTNVFDYKYDATHDWKNHEDSQANFIHLLLFFVAILAFLRMLIQGKRKIISIESTLLIILFLQFNFLNLIIRWEPWNSRIHTPLFFEINLFIVLIFKDFQRMKFMQYSVLILCICYGLFLSIFNYSRPFITSKKYTSSIQINDTRYDKYFTNRMWVKDEYSSFVNLLNKEEKKINVGFISHIDGWEYPIQVVQFNKPNIHFDYIKINNSSVKYLKKKKYKYIYSSYLNKKLLYYNNNKFENIFTKNKNIFVYEREN